MEYALLGLFTSFNFIVLKVKLEHGRVLDFIFDIGSFIILSAIFGGTLGGMAIAMIASFIISLTLFVFPPKIFKGVN